MSWLKRNWYLVLFIIVNLSIAAPAGAMLKDDLCSTSEGGVFGCCTYCMFFCGCDVE